MHRILVIDDEPSVLAAFEGLLQRRGFRVLTASRADAALAELDSLPPDLIIMDVCMPGMNGLEALEAIRARHARLPVIIMTGYGTMDTAIEATKRGAFDYQLKPFEPQIMLASVEKALESVRLMERHVQISPLADACEDDAIVGHCGAMQEVFKSIGRVAPTDAAVLIRGESGTGKELVARALYQHSRRSTEKLLVVNCAAIPPNLLESEMFGYERGAFTGAASRRIGKFEQANGGTIFLDEIGELPMETQAKILRVLQEKTVERIGGTDVIPLDVRVLAATNRNLEEAIAAGDFRTDLYHRLNVVTIHLPPLRERQEDIPRLIDYFLRRFASELKLADIVIAPEAREALVRHVWPGNVCELEHCLHRLTIFSHGHPIQAVDATRAIQQSSSSAVAQAVDDDRLLEYVRGFLDSYGGTQAHEEFMLKAERLLLVEALRRTNGNQTHAARLLDMTRSTLQAKAQKFELRGPRSGLESP